MNSLILQATDTTFHAPHIAYGPLAPILIVAIGATLGVLVEAFVPPVYRRGAQLVLSALTLLGALIAVIELSGSHTLAGAGAVAVDGPTLFIQGTLIVLAVPALLLIAEKDVDPGGPFTGAAAALPGSAYERSLHAQGRRHTEVYPLVLFALMGMLLFPAANTLLVMFVALEVLSLPLYLLCGLARRRRLLSQEAAVKYFLLGAFSSAFFLYGLALIYGYAGTVTLSGIRAATQTANANDSLLFVGLALLSVGLLFKIGAVPFHAWTPDVYQGAPTAVTALMASMTKVAAFGAVLRVLYVSFGTFTWDWRPFMWGVAIVTMVIGVVLALTQTDVKRMLAYSSIAHVGFLLTGVIAANKAGLSGTLFYLLAYGFTVIAAFGVVTLVRDADGEATHLSRWQGLGRRSPMLAGLFGFLLLALAGIPFTSGFTGKFAVFKAAIDGGAAPVVIVAVVMSAAAAFFYVRVIVMMFFQEPASEGPTIAVPGAFTAISLALGLAVTVVLGIVPGPVLDLADKASLFVR